MGWVSIKPGLKTPNSFVVEGLNALFLLQFLFVVKRKGYIHFQEGGGGGGGGGDGGGWSGGNSVKNVWFFLL